MDTYSAPNVCFWESVLFSGKVTISKKCSYRWQALVQKSISPKGVRHIWEPAGRTKEGRKEDGGREVLGSKFQAQNWHWGQDEESDAQLSAEEDWGSGSGLAARLRMGNRRHCLFWLLSHKSFKHTLPPWNSHRPSQLFLTFNPHPSAYLLYLYLIYDLASLCASQPPIPD